MGAGWNGQQRQMPVHEIKHASNLRAPDRIIIYDDGMVTDEDGDVLGGANRGRQGGLARVNFDFKTL